MKIQLTPAALQQANLLADSAASGRGFLLGTTLGAHTLVSSLFGFPWRHRRLDQLMPRLTAAYGDRLLGVYFCNQRFQASEWFLEMPVLEIAGAEMSFSVCRLGGDGIPMLQPLLEEVEEP